ncbi:hypothetical protein AAFF_G00111180 [Aldrovandia affinis]|uniref:Uncharacterized protein n=1 Tax=Aldrovandia affinis TaxID=143900 RepID=A0AAD7WBR4_9TELE|nr:hypothetical protein AAFF_G00111180 [Aldrovandia affinis]
MTRQARPERSPCAAGVNESPSDAGECQAGEEEGCRRPRDGPGHGADELQRRAEPWETHGPPTADSSQPRCERAQIHAPAPAGSRATTGHTGASRPSEQRRGTRSMLYCVKPPEDWSLANP